MWLCENLPCMFVYFYRGGRTSSRALFDSVHFICASRGFIVIDAGMTVVIAVMCLYKNMKSYLGLLMLGYVPYIQINTVNNSKNLVFL